MQSSPNLGDMHLLSQNSWTPVHFIELTLLCELAQLKHQHFFFKQRMKTPSWDSCVLCALGFIHGEQMVTKKNTDDLPLVTKTVAMGKLLWWPVSYWCLLEILDGWWQPGPEGRMDTMCIHSPSVYQWARPVLYSQHGLAWQPFVPRIAKSGWGIHSLSVLDFLLCGISGVGLAKSNTPHFRSA